MLVPFVTILIASLVGSLHCAGMCGAFVAFAVSGDPHQKTKLQAAYHLGRLVTYTFLGAAAGTLGALVNLGGALAGLNQIAIILAGLVMVGFGSTALARQLGYKLTWLHPPAKLTALVVAGQKCALGFNPLPRAAMIGLLTTLLPCGWLYAFAATAAGTGHPVTGAWVMAVFWIGTLPVLVGIGVGAQQLLGAVGRRLPVITALVLIGVGLWTLAGRAGLDAKALAAALSNQPVQQADAKIDSNGSDSSTVEQQESDISLESDLYQRVLEGKEVPPCCQ